MIKRVLVWTGPTQTVNNTLGATVEPIPLLYAYRVKPKTLNRQSWLKIQTDRLQQIETEPIYHFLNSCLEVIFNYYFFVSYLKIGFSIILRDVKETRWITW